MTKLWILSLIKMSQERGLWGVRVSSKIALLSSCCINLCFELRKRACEGMESKLLHVMAGSCLISCLPPNVARCFFCTYVDVVGTGMKSSGSGTAGTVPYLTP
jgi:hypothetical protein